MNGGQAWRFAWPSFAFGHNPVRVAPAAYNRTRVRVLTRSAEEMMMPDVPALPAELAVLVEPFTDDDLDLYLDQRLPLTTGDQEHVARVGNFEIDTEPKAEWAMRKLAELLDRYTEATVYADEWQKRIDEWLDERTAHLNPRIAVFNNALQEYALARRAADDRDKTIRLPSGTVSTKKTTKAQAHIGNEETLLAWLNRTLDTDEFEQVVKTNPKVLVSELRKFVDVARGEHGPRVVWRETGEVVPGMYVQEPGKVTAAVEMETTF